MKKRFKKIDAIMITTVCLLVVICLILEVLPTVGMRTFDSKDGQEIQKQNDDSISGKRKTDNLGERVIPGISILSIPIRNNYGEEVEVEVRIKITTEGESARPPDLTPI